MTEQPMVLVTGASGYIAMHCVLQLLEQSYRVRGTLRSPSREASLRQTFARHVDADDRLEFVIANLLEDEGWDAAMAGCTYVLHVASPVPRVEPGNASELIRPALEGTHRVLEAASKANVKRVVLTSSVAAIYGRQPRDRTRIFDEDDWADPNSDIDPYSKSKTLAERAAWDFVKEHAQLELATINPGMVIGPLLDERYSTSIETIRALMLRRYPGTPRLGWSFVDVRDVAAAHLAAMTTPEAAGQRFCCTHEFMWMRDIAFILHAHFADQGYNIPIRSLPNFVIRFSAIFDKTVRLVVPNLGKRTDFSNARIKSVLNWQPRSLEESIVDTGQSLIDQGIV